MPKSMTLPPIAEMNALLKMIGRATGATAVVVILGDGGNGAVCAVADGRFESVDTVKHMVVQAGPAVIDRLEMVGEL